MKQSYYEYLKKEVNDARFESENLDTTVLFMPELFRVLCELIDEDIIYEIYHPLINKALAYFVLPNDVIPEDIYGIVGYMDDLYVCASVLKIIYADYPDIVDKYWDGDEDLSRTLELCYKRSSEALDENDLKEKTIQFSGLDDMKTD